jgi:hypothetical protein
MRSAESFVRRGAMHAYPLFENATTASALKVTLKNDGLP